MPKTAKHVFERIVAWDNVVAAYDEARKSKRNRISAMRMHANYSAELVSIRDQLGDLAWHPEPCTVFTVSNYGKLRLIEAPTFRDRVVQHAIHRVIEPIFERRFIFDSYSCRKVKGSHAAVDRAEYFMRQGSPKYVLKCDVSKFFPSVRHDILRDIAERSIRDERTLELIARSACANGNATGRGIPIGALTSQLYANVYLDGLDHFAKECIGATKYLRYADDVLILDDDKHWLAGAMNDISWYLQTQRDMRLNPKSGVQPTACGLDYCGYRIWRTHRKPRKRVVRSFGHKLRKAVSDDDYDRAYPLMASFLGYMSHCNSKRTTINTILRTI